MLLFARSDADTAKTIPSQPVQAKDLPRRNRRHKAFSLDGLLYDERRNRTPSSLLEYLTDEVDEAGGWNRPKIVSKSSRLWKNLPNYG